MTELSYNSTLNRAKRNNHQLSYKGNINIQEDDEYGFSLWKAYRVRKWRAEKKISK